MSGKGRGAGRSGEKRGRMAECGEECGGEKRGRGAEPMMEKRACERLLRWLLLAGAALFVVAAGAALVWFVAFSGLNEPVQFIYGGF